ncbi:hypothetical protein [Sphingobacterium cellulitidis]|uniref:hypothetical protein n=1 Tax=Sphingobacterium cellulitidis TaxID=1768011 RepID=UPI00146F0057|nr:hypothetical protein [Sphingobacterium soli]MBA8985151.1 hypothetical protein [Sphingobacterium soli]
MYRSWLGSSSDLVRIFAAKIRQMSEEGPKKVPRNSEFFLNKKWKRFEYHFPKIDSL